MNHPTYAIVTTTAGVTSILHRPTGEIMHNPIGPWAESNALYVEQSRLRHHWVSGTDSELVVYDVGLGAAANALAALHCIFGCSRPELSNPDRVFHLVSFEKEIELLRYALLHADEFAHFKGYEGAIQELIEKKTWTKENVRWDLREGDFTALIAHEPTRPHLIFFDPYSPKMNPEMWSAPTFQKLFERARPTQEGGTRLYTYSQSTPIRVALLQAGFFVGAGHSTGLKEETTVAASDLSLLDSPLGDRWYQRWLKSQSPYPLLATPAEYAAIRESVMQHPQMKGSSTRALLQKG